MNYRLPRKRCRSCGAWIIFVSHERKLNKCFPIDADAVDQLNPRGTLVRVNPKNVDGRIDVVRVPAKIDRDKFKHFYVPHHMTCPEGELWKHRDVFENSIAMDYQRELDLLRDWRESRNRD